MAGADRSIASILGMIALILVIVAAAYFILDEADDSELEIDIGFVELVAEPALLA